MTSKVSRRGGIENKFIGDAVMALFGVPVAKPDAARQAVAAAVEMQQAMVRLRKKWASKNLPLFRIRIGVNTGVVVAGEVGAAERSEYSVIGDDVNLAQRLESLAPADGVLISASTYKESGGEFSVEEPRVVTVKGRRELVKVYQVVIPADEEA